MITDCNEAKEDFTGYLDFTKKEIGTMPEHFKKYFYAEGLKVPYRKRRRTKNKNCYTFEGRYRRHGYNINAYGGTLEELKKDFIRKLHKTPPRDGAVAAAIPSVPSTFNEFAQYYFTHFYKRKVTAETFKNETNRYNRYLLPLFGSMPLKAITPLQCQDLLDDVQAAGKGKTAQELKSMLNNIFTAAIKHSILTHNPLDVIFYVKYHTKTPGKALTYEQESKLFAVTQGTHYQIMYAVALYCGLRPNEYKSAHVEGNFIVAVNSKQKDGRIHYKKIPITPMLAPFLSEGAKIEFIGANRLAEHLRKIMPGIALKDLRTTFYTRCVECNVAEVAREKFMGHSLRGLAETYTDVPDEYLYAEGQKFYYVLPPFCPQSD